MIGTSLFFWLLRPRHPPLPQPKVHTSPRAVAATERFSPPATMTILSPPNLAVLTFVGVSLFLLLPCHNWPRIPRPNVQSSPPAVTTIVCLPPQATITTADRWPPNASSLVGLDLINWSPWPRQPPSPLPQVHNAPSDDTANEWKLPAASITNRAPCISTPCTNVCSEVSPRCISPVPYLNS